MNAKAYNCPTVLSLHDLYPFDIPENFGFWKSILARRTAKRCIRLVDAIACVSESTAASLGESFPAEAAKATIIPNVVQLAGPSATDCGLETLRGRTFILCVAQHRCNKNVPLTIRVFERALRKGFIPADSLLVVVGIGGPETKRIGAQIIQLRLEKKVLLVSGMTDPGLRWCYENCAVLLACSNAEGFGLPVAEGLLAGCRIVCSDIPAFREVGAVTCRFVSWGPDLIGRYAEAIRELLVLPKPSSTVLPRYSVGTVGQQYVDLYESLICSRLPGFDMLRQLDSVPRGANSMGSRPI